MIEFQLEIVLSLHVKVLDARGGEAAGVAVASVGKGFRADTPLQSLETLEGSMMEQVFPCGLWRHHAGAGIHIAARGEPNPGVGGCSPKELRSMESPQ